MHFSTAFVTSVTVLSLASALPIDFQESHHDVHPNDATSELGHETIRARNIYGRSDATPLLTAAEQAQRKQEAASVAAAAGQPPRTGPVIKNNPADKYNPNKLEQNLKKSGLLRVRSDTTPLLTPAEQEQRKQEAASVAAAAGQPPRTGPVIKNNPADQYNPNKLEQNLKKSGLLRVRSDTTPLLTPAEQEQRKQEAAAAGQPPRTGPVIKNNPADKYNPNKLEQNLKKSGLLRVRSDTTPLLTPAEQEQRKQEAAAAGQPPRTGPVIKNNPADKYNPNKLEQNLKKTGLLRV